ncbi:MAG: TetR/AcrR family transcriptional regulator [Pseudonocardia sp.]|uniref:TetR/AcrR family transcriptional regulator n=1 Tax=unclassified Pseudonocardia TaxID=2619320 RepID=UPI00086AF85F|nr:MULTISPECIES: TetR/AcrR family transcriptional regulator [unclassified Pseudonocardia]MBN9112525.1 TetR/AcrR family transcriptional regulator [Pseudonocardia sp.]ODU24598.1 MAG: TetR family transcriptional regulator [Pseudonocardia sp. SCN 72-51]ODV07081.1 MAG: TetR family transcriptional regulator [Pseudonocardia sp. SCN 73-27]RTL68409.1 MAG: TetR/AcrR family transcriptional regulator [Pseudonocardiaceae bacterium]
MPRVSSDQLEARRRQILDGARACFARHGYEGATVRRLEQTTGMSRGAIFHYFRDKQALFLAIAEQDARVMAEVVAEQGLVQVMRELLSSPDSRPAGWTGTYLEMARKARTDPTFRESWQAYSAELTGATRARLERQAASGALRADVDLTVLTQYLELVLEGLVSHLAMGLPAGDLGNVLDVVEQSVRRAGGTLADV